jgi:ATP-dependent RNA helicase RhlE
MTNKNTEEARGFHGLGLAPRLLEILDELDFNSPTPIQTQSIPASLAGKDLVGIAQTGTGKTLAFGLPMLQRLAAYKGMGLVVLPTRELASQVDESLRDIGRRIGLRTAVLIGGEAMPRQLKALRQKPHIIVATPGRLIDHVGRGTVKLGQVKILVLDEADMMLDMGFLPQIQEILKTVPKERQTMLFSATMPEQIMKIAADHMALPVRIEVARAGTAADSVEQEIIIVDKDNKYSQLKSIVTSMTGSVLIFARTKHGVKNLTMKLRADGLAAAEIHSNRSLIQRREALQGFKLGKYRLLIATDIAARGIDVKGIELVVNYDLPAHSEDYVHRIGRTGRAGLSGKAVSLALPNQWKDIKNIERLIHQNIPVTRLSSEKFPPAASASGGQTRQNFSRQSRPQAKRRSSAAGFPGSGSRPYKKDSSSHRQEKDFSGSPARKKPNKSRTNGQNIKLPLTDRQKFLRSMRFER